MVQLPSAWSLHDPGIIDVTASYGSKLLKSLSMCCWVQWDILISSTKEKQKWHSREVKKLLKQKEARSGGCGKAFKWKNRFLKNQF